MTASESVEIIDKLTEIGETEEQMSTTTNTSVYEDAQINIDDLQITLIMLGGLLKDAISFTRVRSCS